MDDSHPSPSQPSSPSTPDAAAAHDDPSTQIDDPYISRLSPRRRVKRAVDRLGRSLSPRSSFQLPTRGHRPMRSLTHKSHSKTASSDPADGDVDAYSEPSTRTPTPSTSPKSTASLAATHNDDSPFIRPPSPSSPPTRPSLQHFRGSGSMRAGTQTLIQALQAIPWTDCPDNEDDIGHRGFTGADSDSDDDDKPRHLASSIHAIYRPLARSRRAESILAASRAEVFARVSEEEEEEEGVEEEVEEEDSEEVSVSDPEDDEEPTQDFEEATPRLPDADGLGRSQQLMASSQQLGQSILPSRPSITRSSGTMAIVRVQRRVRLAQKLKEIFVLDAIEEVWAEMPCWLLRSVLLQGYMYLTNSYLCFFAHMPTRENQVIKSGMLTKKAQRTKRWIKHWFVLKNDALSWYQSSSDPYFPHGIVDLRYAISCEPKHEKEIRLRTNQKNVTLYADSVPSRDEWVKAIQKVIFKAQNMGESVKIAIPYSAIREVEKSAAMDFSETIEVQVFDKEEQSLFDSYFFAYFHDLPQALEDIRDAVRTYQSLPGKALSQTVMDTTLAARVARQPPVDRTQSLPSSESSKPSRLSSFLRPFQDTLSLGRAASVPEEPDKEEFTHVFRRGRLALTASPESGFENLPEQGQDASNLTPATYSNPTIFWSVGMPSWLKGTSRKFLGSGNSPVANGRLEPPTPSTTATTQTGISEVLSSLKSWNRQSGNAEHGFSVLESPGVPIDPEMTEKFRNTFAVDEKEPLLGYFQGYIFRLLPVYGRLYISTNYFCFKSSGPLTTRTRMMMPIRDILALEKTRATRFGQHGLVVIIKGHEELFFEFSAEDRRNAFINLLEHQLEDMRRLACGGQPPPTKDQRDALIIEELGATAPSTAETAAPLPHREDMTDSVPAVMFTSASYTFLTFRPKESMHFTFLTIGSRGDVQPYIALAKGLLADGHRVRIATHGEFQEWIESHGIEYGYVGGDPAELMRICVENGMFTVSFLREVLQKFRGWLDDLLKTAWEACRGTDVLIESPSAMGGYHIAEALGIPYFRAFTMTWTRTRAYPHAFAVPEHKMGGNYNYMSYVMFDQVFWRATAGQINRWRRETLKLGSTSLDKMETHKIPFLYNFSPTVVPQPLDWPEWIRVTGYWFLHDADVSAKKWQPPPELNEFISSARNQGKKIVYIGFGSIVVSDPRSMTRCVIEAVVRSGVHAILSKGWSDRLHTKTVEASEIEEPLPPQIYPIQSIPHDWLFQRIDAACHHGGAGTTGASLRAGIPTIIHPFFGDQFFWADRVEALGVGSGVRKLTVENLTEALIAATSDVKQIDRAKIVGQQIRSENGVATAVESIYRDLEYAKSLIKRTSVDDDSERIAVKLPTIRDHKKQSLSVSTAGSGYSSSNSARGAPSEDWSVVSDQEEPRPDEQRQGTLDHSPYKRSSLAAAMWSVLPESLAPSRHRSNSPSLPM